MPIPPGARWSPGAALAACWATGWPWVGEMYRLLGEGLAADVIAERLEGGAAGAWRYRRMVSAVLDGNLPIAPTVALAAARRYRTVLKAPALSAAARS
jgi:hypothetical protein